MNRLPIIGRLAAVVSGLAVAMLAWCAGAALAAVAAVVAPLGGATTGWLRSPPERRSP